MESVFIPLLSVSLFLSVQGQGFTVRYGRVTFQTSGEFGCNTTTLKTPFTSSDVKVQLAVYNYLDDIKPTYEAAVAWVEQVSTNKFSTCVRISGPCCPSSSSKLRSIGLPYIAYTGRPSRFVDGSVNLPLWTTGTKCVLVPIRGMTFTSPPYVYATAEHTTPQNKHDATSVWVEDIKLDSFKLCLRELKNFDGIHKSIKVNWMALKGIPTEMSDNIPIQDTFLMPNSDSLTPGTHYSFCKHVNFTSPFYEVPHVITSASHVTDPSNSFSVKPENNAITEWVEDISTSGFRVCMKDLQPFDKYHDAVTITYLTVGNLHPCIPIKCDFYKKCVAYSAKEALCECDDSCPDYNNPVCATNGKTYKNLCQFRLDICKTGGNITMTILHNGSCVIPFVLHRGRVPLRLDTAEVQCKPVAFKTRDLNQSLPIHVQSSINYYNESGLVVHDAAVTWVEKISSAGFSVCVLKAGRNDRLLTIGDNGMTFVDYIAYQGAPAGTVSGEKNIRQWWDGTTCTSIDLPPGKFSKTPHILVTAEHGATDLKHDAATIWIEDPTTSNFKVCLRELQNFDGLHKDINVNWIAYESLPKNLTSEQQLVLFPNGEAPFDRHNHAYCKDLMFDYRYPQAPTIIISASHSTGVGKLEPDYNSIAVWLEDITTSLCRICIKELHTPRGTYDPVKVSTLVIGSRI